MKSILKNMVNLKVICNELIIIVKKIFKWVCYLATFIVWSNLGRYGKRNCFKGYGSLYDYAEYISNAGPLKFGASLTLLGSFC